MSFRQSAVFQGVLLGGFALAAAALLAAGDRSTADAIALRKAEDLKASLSQVVPKNLYDNDILKDKLTTTIGDQKTDVYQAKRKGKVIAVAYQVLGYGYGGEIAVIMGIEASGKLLGVRVVSHAETPGLGDKIEEKKGDWIFGFEGLSLTNPLPVKWAVKKDGGHFDQFSGATITPRAVVAAVKAGLTYFEANKAKFLQEEKAP